MFNAALKYDNGFPNEGYAELEKIGEIEFVLTPVRQEVGSGFIDRLFLEFSRDIKSIPDRKNVAKALLDLVQYRPYTEDLFYHPLDRLDAPETAFIRQESGILYGTDRADVVRVVNELFSTIDELLHHRHSLVLNVSLDGLGYFDHVTVRPGGSQYSIEERLVVPEPRFYAARYPGTHDTRFWLQSKFPAKNSSVNLDNK